MIEELQSQFGVQGAVNFSTGNNGLPTVQLTHRSGAGAEVYLHGAHITSWTNSQGDELFFVSRESFFAPDKPIRGGIPVIFPQFGGGPLPQHGLARISDWTPAQTGVGEDGTVSLVLSLTDAPATQALWPYAFALELGVQLREDNLTVTYRARNTGREAFDYYAVLHTYFRMADIHTASLYGLEGITFIDSLRDDIREVEARPVIRFAEETDRIYVDAPNTLCLKDEASNRTFTIEKRNMPDVVVWNPWIAKAQRMPDFGDDEYQWMVCVETGNMAGPRTLSAGDEWYGETTFSVS
ncbi:MAG: D-hexose-6-phosphate mutarotase [Armatimonadota bacterium]